MSTSNDWVENAATEIAAICDASSKSNIELLKQVVIDHCPFKPDTAYIPVPRCETCQHWRPRTGSTITGFCYSPKVARGYSVPVPDGGALVEDDEGWAILTHKDFGCVQWEKR